VRKYGTGRIVLIVALALAGCLVAVFGALLAVSPGRTTPFRDGARGVLAGSISEKIRVRVNGVEQGMFIKARDQTKPVLLFLHGGAGMPEYFLDRRHPSHLEDSFVVCWWDRRGAGLSYSKDAPPQALTLEQMVSDTLAVTSYLRDRFHQRMIYLMAHSGGTLIGIQAAARAPELYHAYIGIGQMTSQVRSEVLAYEYMRERYQQSGNTGMLRRLESAPPTLSVPLPASYMAIRDKAMHELGVGTMRGMKSVITGVFLASWLCPDYTIGEKLSLWRGKFSSDKALWNAMLLVDIPALVPSVGLPVYFFHGGFDYTVSLPLARAYFDGLKAPVKGFYTFKGSAHSPMFEEPAAMRRVIEQDVLGGKTLLADGPA
jgi:pimeloyl-ACP methyl ester carboxylesterase